MNRRQLLSTALALPLASELTQVGLRAEPTPKFHFRPGLVAYSYRKQLAAKSLKYEELIRRVADWGLDGLDCTAYWFPDLPNTPNEYIASLRKTAFKNGVQIYNSGVRVQLAQPTPELQNAEFENIRKWVDMTERLGGSQMRVFGGRVPNGASEEQAIGWAVEVLKRGAEYAGTKGITLGVEDDAGLTIAAKATVEIVRRAASPWAGINADSGNLRTNGYAQFEMMVPYGTSVHLKTLVSDENGKKEPADWNRLLAMLGKAGYRGYIGLEYEGDNADADVPRYAENLRTLIRKVSE